MAIKQLLSGAADGEDIDVIMPKIFNQDRIKTHPDVKTFSENGQLMVDPVTGVKAMVFPDGRIESVK